MIAFVLACLAQCPNQNCPPPTFVGPTVVMPIAPPALPAPRVELPKPPPVVEAPPAPKAEPPKPAAEAPAEVPNFGINVAELGRPTERIELNGRPIGKALAADLLRQDTLADDSGKRRLTIIGTDAERKAVMDDLAGPLAKEARDLLVQGYPPDHWAVTGAGFMNSGHPTIYVQEASGKVRHRQDDYADGAAGLGKALEALRQPDPGLIRTWG